VSAARDNQPRIQNFSASRAREDAPMTAQKHAFKAGLKRVPPAALKNRSECAECDIHAPCATRASCWSNVNFDVLVLLINSLG
jgi:hypothetical protein